MQLKAPLTRSFYLKTFTMLSNLEYAVNWISFPKLILSLCSFRISEQLQVAGKYVPNNRTRWPHGSPFISIHLIHATDLTVSIYRRTLLGTISLSIPVSKKYLALSRTAERARIGQSTTLLTLAQVSTVSERRNPKGGSKHVILKKATWITTRANLPSMMLNTLDNPCHTTRVVQADRDPLVLTLLGEFSSTWCGRNV